MKTITAESALQALETIVKQRGEDYVYEEMDAGGNCFYVRDGRPSCGVGVALQTLGVAVNKLETFEGSGAWSLDGLHRYITRGAARVFAAFQHDQDRGHTWGDALQRARVTAERLTR